MSDRRLIIKSASVISFNTILSRFTGFFRDIFVARLFGTGMSAEAFFVAFKIPNMFRDVLGEGAGNAAFVPVFCEEISKRSAKDFQRLVSTVLFLLAVVTSALALIGIILSPVIVRLVAPGFLADTEKYSLTVSLTRLLFPYLIFISLSAYLMAVAYSLKSFAAASFSSVVFNLVLIAGLAGMMIWGGGVSIYALAVLVLLGGIAQMAVQVPFIRRRGVDFRLKEVGPNAWHQPAVRKIGRLMGPRLLGTAIYEMNIFVDTIFASLSGWVGLGAVAAVYYANRLIQFPLAIGGVALSNASLPVIAEQGARRDMDGFGRNLSFLLRVIVILMLPSSAGLVVLSKPIVEAVFQRGSFDAYSAQITSVAVVCYGLGLVFFAGVRFLSQGFYALQDTKTPVKTASVAFLLNIGLNALFVFVLRMGLAGLALASVFSSGVNCMILYTVLRRRVGVCSGSGLRDRLLRCSVASGVMAVAASVVARVWLPSPAPLGPLLGVLFFAAGVYGVMLYLLRVPEIREVWSWWARKR